MIDCGAYDGDTLKSFVEVFSNRVHDYLAIEPDVQSSRILQTWVSGYLSSKTNSNLNVRIVNGVVSDRHGSVLFEGAGAGGKIIESQRHGEPSGLATVDCTTIDRLRGEVKWNLIKMDIEGAEMDALAGAQDTITELRPGLAISVYHRPSDLWEVPLLINDLSEGSYQLFLRQEGYWGEETIIYGTPNRTP